jgi:hypothetical protein
LRVLSLSIDYFSTRSAAMIPARLFTPSFLLKGPQGEKVFEAYAEQSTPAAYRVFWYYGPEENRITVIAITPHP